MSKYHLHRQFYTRRTLVIERSEDGRCIEGQYVRDIAAIELWDYQTGLIKITFHKEPDAE